MIKNEKAQISWEETPQKGRSIQLEEGKGSSWDWYHQEIQHFQSRRLLEIQQDVWPNHIPYFKNQIAISPRSIQSQISWAIAW